MTNEELSLSRNDDKPDFINRFSHLFRGTMWNMVEK